MSVYNRTYTVAELIARLETIRRAHGGDVPVVLKDPDTGWHLEVGVTFEARDEENGYPNRVDLRGDYNLRPRGHNERGE